MEGYLVTKLSQHYCQIRYVWKYTSGSQPCIFLPGASATLESFQTLHVQIGAKQPDDNGATSKKDIQLWSMSSYGMEECKLMNEVSPSPRATLKSKESLELAAVTRNWRFRWRAWLEITVVFL